MDDPNLEIDMTLAVEILVTDDCPHAESTLDRVKGVLASLAPGVSPVLRTIRDQDEALALGFRGSPTVRVNGEDLEGPDARRAAPEGHHPAFPPEGQQPAFPPKGRRYGSHEIPPTWLVEAAVLRALGPKHLLFLCVANSARSQMAEGIARSLAPAHIRISSAGSEPTQIRPEAVQVLQELGIDPADQHSKGMEAVGDGVDAVITLCAEEVCPAWLGRAWRVHWGLPDPAAVQGSDEERLEAFREVREEIARRLERLLAP